MSETAVSEVKIIGGNQNSSSPGERKLIFRKNERLRHKTLVDTLFRKGVTLYEFPLRLTWMKFDAENLSGMFRDNVPPSVGPIQMLVTVPKKKRKKAVDRVLMRRRIREAYRLNRLPLKKVTAEDPAGGVLALAFIYIDNKNTDYRHVEKKMKLLLKKVNSALSQQKCSQESL